jgi:pantothenate synthetase
VRDALQTEGLAVEYVELVDPEDLAPVTDATPDAVLALAARAGRTRLIDNIVLGAGLAADRVVEA